MKLAYTFVIAAAILLGFLTLSYTVSLNGRYMFHSHTDGGLFILETRTGQSTTGGSLGGGTMGNPSRAASEGVWSCVWVC